MRSRTLALLPLCLAVAAHAGEDAAAAAPGRLYRAPALAALIDVGGQAEACGGEEADRRVIIGHDQGDGAEAGCGHASGVARDAGREQGWRGQW